MAPNPHLTRSELIDLLASKQPEVPYADMEAAVKGLLDHMVEVISCGERIEIRGFGSFSLRSLPPRVGRNPKTGEPVARPVRHAVHIKPGHEHRVQLEESRPTVRPNDSDREGGRENHRHASTQPSVDE